MNKTILQLQDERPELYIPLSTMNFETSTALTENHLTQLLEDDLLICESDNFIHELLFDFSSPVKSKANLQPSNILQKVNAELNRQEVERNIFAPAFFK